MAIYEVCIWSILFLRVVPPASYKRKITKQNKMLSSMQHMDCILNLQFLPCNARTAMASSPCIHRLKC